MSHRIFNNPILSDIAEKIENSTYEDFFIKYEYILDIPNADYFLIKAYENILDRKPDKEGFEFWLQNLTNHKITRESIVLTLLDSDEYKKEC